jgi:hypothetical protein
MQFLKTEKGKDLIIIDGYQYYKDKLSEYKTIWKCIYFESLNAEQEYTHQVQLFFSNFENMNMKSLSNCKNKLRE